MSKRVKWSKILPVLGAVTAVFALATVAYASTHGGGEAGPLGIPIAKWKDLLWRVLNFIGLVIILVVALKKPIGNALSSRRRQIREMFEDLEAQKNEAELKYKEYEAKLAKIDEEVNSIIETAVKQGEAEKEKIIADAERAAGDIKRQAEMAVQHELSEAKHRLLGDVAEQAVQMAEEIITKNLQESDHNKMVEDYLDKVGAIQ